MVVVDGVNNGDVGTVQLNILAIVLMLMAKLFCLTLLLEHCQVIV